MINLVEGAVKLANDTRRSAFIEAAEIAGKKADEYALERQRAIAGKSCLTPDGCRCAEAALRSLARDLLEEAG